MPLASRVAPAVALYVGGQPRRVQGQRDDGDWPRMFTPVHPPGKGLPLTPQWAVLDSGAFSDPPERRLSPAATLERQLAWEGAASAAWGVPWRAAALVSADRLIDEVWHGGKRTKQRWSAQEGAWAVKETIAGARYLASRRALVWPRTLILACQGVLAAQYVVCVRAVLEVARPADCLGLGGWCLLGRARAWLPEFWRTLTRVLPLVRDAGLRHVHLFGVLSLPALGGLLWMADQYGLVVSTDSAAPLLACTWPDARKAGVRRAGFRANVAWWQDALAGLRSSRHYRSPAQQLEMDWGPAHGG